MAGPRVLDVAANGFVFDALAAGPDDGPLVLFLHGFPETKDCWVAALDACAAAGRRAVAFDQRGYGPRARPEALGDYAVGALVSDVTAVADALGAGHFDLVGHDWGGAVAWATAVIHPDRVRRLVSVSTPHPAALGLAIADDSSDQRLRSAYMEFFRAPGSEDAFLKDDGALLRAMFEGSGYPDCDRYVAHFVADPDALRHGLDWYRANAGIPTDVPPVRVPTLFVWSDGDVALGPDAARTTGDFVDAEYRFEVLGGVSHWIPETAAGPLAALTADWVAAG